MFVDAFAVRQMTILIVAQLNQPIEHIVRPYAIGKDSFGISTQCAEQFWNCAVMPTNQNVRAVRPALDFIGQFKELFVLEPGVKGKIEFLGDRFEGEARAITAAEIAAAKR